MNNSSINYNKGVSLSGSGRLANNQGLFAGKIMQPLAKLFDSPWRIALLICCSAFLIRLISLGLYPLQDTSEARYGEMARLMVETNDWITVWFDYNVPFWGKPPLFIWLSALSFKLFGINEFAARLPSLLVGLVILGFTLKLALFQMGQSAGRLVLILLPSTAIFLVISGAVLAEPVTLLAITMILTSFWIGWHADDPKQARCWQYTFFLGCAVALLAKGLAALVLAGLPVFFWCLPDRKLLTLWKKFPWIKGTLLTLAIAAPWYIAAEIKTPGFLQYFIIGEHFQRYLDSGWDGDQYGAAHIRPIGTIWLRWLQSCFPWSFIVVALGLKWGKNYLTGNRESINSWRVFLLLWLICPLAFFTFARNIIWTYAFPVVPAMVLLLADIWKDKWHLWPKRIIATALVTPCLMVALTIVLMNGGGQKSHKQLMEVVHQQHIENPEILYLYGAPFSARFYSGGKAKSIESIKQLQENLSQTGKRFFLATEDDDFSNLPLGIRNRFTEISRYRDWTLYLDKY